MSLGMEESLLLGTNLRQMKPIKGINESGGREKKVCVTCRKATCSSLEANFFNGIIIIIIIKVPKYNIFLK
jgi:hypothetical protein